MCFLMWTSVMRLPITFRCFHIFSLLFSISDRKWTQQATHRRWTLNKRKLEQNSIWKWQQQQKIDERKVRANEQTNQINIRSLASLLLPLRWNETILFEDVQYAVRYRLQTCEEDDSRQEFQTRKRKEIDAWRRHFLTFANFEIQNWQNRVQLNEISRSHFRFFSQHYRILSVRVCRIIQIHYHFRKKIHCVWAPSDKGAICEKSHWNCKKISGKDITKAGEQRESRNRKRR